MGGVAALAREKGHAVRGSDQAIYPPMSTQLERLGIALDPGYRADSVAPDCDEVVIGNARGLGIQNDQFTPTALRDAFKEIHAEQDALCKRPEFAAIYARSACHLGDLTISQLADSSRLANADKAAFSKVRKESQDIGRKAAAAYRAFGGDRGRRVAAAIDRAEVMAERNGVDLYQGHITWGEYSQRRREVNQVYRDDFRRIHNQLR